MNKITADEMCAVPQSRVTSIDFLFDDFDRLIQSPESVHRLRRFILDLAVRGKLVPKDSNDEPASELLKRIADEKVRLVKAGEIVTKAPGPSGKPVEQDFLTPANWTIAKLADISNIVMGQSPKGETYNTDREGVPLINGPVEFSEGPFGKTVINQYTTAPTNFCNKGDFLICVRGSTTGRSNIAGFGACIGRGVAAIQPVFEDDFVRFFLWSMRERIISMGRGAAFPSITRKQLENLPVPLPPIAEQRRIVAAVEELMVLCDRLEAARAEREATRDRLATASLARLNAPDPDPAKFQHDVAFVLKNLGPLTTRPDQIKALRQTILNLAVRGKLVPQDPNDEPASELVRTISDTREEMFKAGKVKRPKNLSPILASEILYEIPRSWSWVQANVLWDFENGDRGKNYPSQDQLVENGIPFVNAGHLVEGRVSMSQMNFITTERFRRLKGGKLRNGDQIYCLRGSLGKHAIYNYDAEGAIASSLVILRPIERQSVPYLFIYLESQIAEQMLERFDNGSAQPNLSSANLRKYEIPLPPLAEQRRIVAKVDELLANCDQLEASLVTGDATKGQLLQTMLHDVLNSGKAVATY